MNAAARMQSAPFAVAGPARQHHHQRPQALAAAADDVLGDLVDQRHSTVKAAADGLIDRQQVRPDQRADALERLAAAIINAQLSVSPREYVV